MSSFSHMNRLAQDLQNLYSGENSFLDLPWHLNKPARASQHPVVDSNGVIRSFTHINRFAPTSKGHRNVENCFLDFLRHLNRPASSPCTAPPRSLKRRYELFLTYGQACTSLTGHLQWWKKLSRSSAARKQACTCFTAPPR